MHLIHSCRTVNAGTTAYIKIADKNPNRSSLHIIRITDSSLIGSLSLDGVMPFVYLRQQDDRWLFDESNMWDGEVFLSNSDVGLMTCLVMEVSKHG